MKMIVGDGKTGKSYTVEIDKDKAVFLYGKKIGEEVDGGEFGLAGYVQDYWWK